MSDHSELKKLAEAATPGRWTAYDTHGRRFIEAIGTEDHVVCATPKKQWLKDSQYIAAADPVTVLALIADLERNQRMLLAACVDMGAIGNALKADMNADGDELLGMVIDLKAQNSRMLGWLKDISKTSGDKGAVMGARQLLKEFDKGDRP